MSGPGRCLAGALSAATLLFGLAACSADEDELREVFETERHLFYVACTRARDRLHITGVKPVSDFVADIVVRKK